MTSFPRSAACNSIRFGTFKTSVLRLGAIRRCFTHFCSGSLGGGKMGESLLFAVSEGPKALIPASAELVQGQRNPGSYIPPRIWQRTLFKHKKRVCPKSRRRQNSLFAALCITYSPDRAILMITLFFNWKPFEEALEAGTSHRTSFGAPALLAPPFQNGLSQKGETAWVPPPPPQ